MFRNKATYLNDQDALYHFCDGTLLNLYIHKMNQFYTTLTEIKLNTDPKYTQDSNNEYLHFKIMLDFLVHFLWWNIEWDSLMQNELKFKSDYVRDYISDFEGNDERLIILCIN